MAAAAAGGRRGSYRATACVLVGWGLAVVYLGAVKPADIDPAGAYLVGQASARSPESCSRDIASTSALSA